MKKMMIGCCLAFASMSAMADVYKCAGANGKIEYQATPCTSGEQKVIDDRNARRDRKITQDRETAEKLVSKSSRENSQIIDFGNDPQTQLIRATAIFESLQIDGRDCEWALKVDKNMTKCMTFMLQMTEGGNWSQATQMVNTLLKDEANYRANVAAFGKIQRLMTNIAGYSELAKVRLIGTQ